MKRAIEAENLLKVRAAMPMETRAISAKELAGLLSLSSRAIWRLVSAGRLPRMVSIGGSKRFLMSDVNLLLECNCDMAVYQARREQQKC